MTYDLGSDHLPVEVELDLNTPSDDSGRYVRCFNRADWKKFRSIVDHSIDLQYFSFQPDVATSIIDEGISHLTNIINTATHESVPLCRVSRSHLQIPQFLLDLIFERRRLRRQYVRHGRPQILGRGIGHLTRIIDHHFELLHNDAFQRTLGRIKLNGDFNRELFKLARNLRGPRVGLGPLKRDLQFFVSDIERANALAISFRDNHMTTHSTGSSSTHEAGIEDDALAIRLLQPETDFAQVFVKTTEVKSILQGLRGGKAPGYDRIRNEALKNASRKMVVAITHILNACLRRCYFPKAWRHAIATPIPKPNKPSSRPSSYRPISLLSNLSKVFERIILAKLTHHIRDKLPEFQFGFRPGRSTCHQVRRVVNHIRDNFSRGYSTGMVLVDLQAAFDSVWHDALVCKLRALGCPLHLVKLIQSFLDERTFAVKVGGGLSRLINIPAGVPQGAVLSPSLFNVFMADIPTTERCFVSQFADDIAILASSKSPPFIKSRLQGHMDTISKYCKNGDLKSVLPRLRWYISVDVQILDLHLVPE